MNLNNWQIWLKIVISLVCLILISFGFLLGYLYNDTSCTESPFTYGIEKLNERNNDNFTCLCSSYSGKLKPFSFNHNGIIKDNLFLNYS